MAISTLCPGCLSLFRLPEELAGKHVRCQKCSHMLTVPGVLAPPPRTLPVAPPVAAAPPPVAQHAPSVPAQVAPTEAPPPFHEGMPGVVVVEVPVRPAPPPLPEATEPPRPTQTPATSRPAPSMTLTSRERPRRNTNRPRRPSSALAGLSLGAMLLLFVGLAGGSLIAWIVTEVQSQQPRPPMAQKMPVNPGIGKGPMIIQPMRPKGAPGGGAIINPGFAQEPPPKNGAQGTRQKFNPGPNGAKLDDQRAIRIRLQNGQALVRQQWSNQDPMDPVQRWQPPVRLPCKRFLVDLEEGKRYTIDYQRAAHTPDFDPYLRIEDLAGNRLVEHDDVGDIVPAKGNNHDMNSRIEFHPPKTATYRIICTLYQKPFFGQMEFTVTIRERRVSPPAVPNVAVAWPDKGGNRFTTTPATEKGLLASVLTLPNGGFRSLGDLCLSADGKWLYGLWGPNAENDSSGILVKLKSDDLTVVAQLSLGRKSAGLAIASQGLLVTIPPAPWVVNKGQPAGLPAAHEVWLIDPETLRVKSRFGAFLRPDSAAVVAAPNLPYAFVAGAGETSSYPDGYGILVLDLNGVKPARFYDYPNTALALSPRGDYLFAMAGDVLHSFAFNKDTGALEAKQSSHKYSRIGNAHYRIDFSPDGKRVCVSGANLPSALQKEHPKWHSTSVPVYPVADVRKPVFTIDTDMPPRAVGFDTARANRILSQNDKTGLTIFDGAGNRVESYQMAMLPNKDDQPLRALQFLIPRDGNQVLIRYEDRFCAVTLKPNAGPVVVRPKTNFPAVTVVKDGESITGEVKKQADMTWRELQLPNRGEIDPVWDADGKALFHMDADGTLIRYRAGDFTPTARLALGRAARTMALSAQGLVVAFRDEPEVWVIEPRSLQVLRSIAVFNPVRELACHPKQDRAVAVGFQVLLLDLKQGRVVARGLQPHQDADVPFRRPMLTPDGKYVLLASAVAGKVLRVKLEPDRLVVAETRTTAVRGPHAFCVTADGKQVAWYHLYGKGKQQPVEFYTIDDWKQPAVTLPVSARAMAAGDDGSIYVQTTEFALQRFASAAAKEGTPLRWDEGRVGIREIAVQPGRPRAFVASLGTRVLLGERNR